MEYEDLYDESPYTSKVIPRQGGMMSSIRATLLICATILASVLGITYYGYQQDQFVVNSQANYVAIFDKKLKTLNICDKGSCILLFPNFESHPMTQGMGPQGPAPQGGYPQQGPVGPNGQRLLGTYPQPQQMPNPQMMQQGGAPQQMMNPQMMQQQMPNPQMYRQMQQRGGVPQQMGGPQMIRGAPQPIQAQVTGGVAAPPAPANQASASAAGDDTAAADDAATDASDADTSGATADDAAPSASDDATEEPAPV